MSFWPFEVSLQASKLLDFEFLNNIQACALHLLFDSADEGSCIGMNAIKRPTERASFHLGQEENLKSPSLVAICDVWMDDTGTAKACNKIHRLHQELISELLSFMSERDLARPVNGNIVIFKQTSDEMLLVLRTVSRQWILMRHDMQLLLREKLRGPSYFDWPFLPGRSTLNYTGFSAYSRAASIPSTQGHTSITQPTDLRLSSNWIANQILNVLQSYGKHNESSAQPKTEWMGRDNFLPQVQRRVERIESVQMILPSFPWKSVGKRTLNDFNDMC